MHDADYVLGTYNPTLREAIIDFKFLKNKLLNTRYEELADFDDDYTFFIRTYYYSLFENLSVKSRDELFKDVLEVLIKRKVYMVAADVKRETDKK